ncbi:PREDICTED: putative uncharacterized protein MGC34800 [Haliaeetus leucocephalus]|uniref:putative uncharacterized protein MGC34800 n=1 Tax=Haliaeetus leucocephalus TaxID=52644 RepID=UPI00053CE125|nr:PREDICTED: putative uncharacterized protein MGC34800 [Haliaeetus leucocephalus]
MAAQRWACWVMVTGARGAGTLGPASSPPSCPGPHGERGGVGRPGEARLAPLRSLLPPAPALPRLTSDHLAPAPRSARAAPRQPPLLASGSPEERRLQRRGPCHVPFLAPRFSPPVPHRLCPCVRGPPAPGAGLAGRAAGAVPGWAACPAEPAGVPPDCPPPSCRITCWTGCPTPRRQLGCASDCSSAALAASRLQTLTSAGPSALLPPTSSLGPCP